MSFMSYKDAREKYEQEGMYCAFTFEEYVEYLETCHIHVVRNEA